MTKSTAIFGYGSLVWRPGFEYESKEVGFIRGYKRVFWQGSTDHRGTPEAPGRTVTLAEEEGAVTWGVAYRLAGSQEQQQQTIAYLEWREKQYDVRRLCHMYTADSPEQPVLMDVLVYIATDSASNVNWLGPAPLPAIARQMAISRGPSGPNHEYLLQLAAAMRQIKVVDPELFELEGMVKRLMAAAASELDIQQEPGEAAVAAAAAAVAAVAAAAGAAAGGTDGMSATAGQARHAVQTCAAASGASGS